MFASPRGKSKATISSSHLWLISLSNKSCVGLDVYERQGKKETSSSNEFMLSGFRICMKFYGSPREHFCICFWGGVGGAVGGPVGGAGGLRRQADGAKKGYVCAMSTDLKYSSYFVYIDRPSQTNVSWPPFLNCLFIQEETCTGGSQGCYSDPNVFRLWLICGVWRGWRSAPPPFGEGWGGGKGFGLDCYKWYHLIWIKEGFCGSNSSLFHHPTIGRD